MLGYVQKQYALIGRRRRRRQTIMCITSNKYFHPYHV